MTDFQRDVLEAHGYEVGDDLRPGERPARAVPGAVAARPVPLRAPEQQESVSALLDAVPPYFSQAVITEDRTHGDARLRHPADAARPPEGGDRRHREPARPARGRRRRRRRACPCWPPRRTTRSPTRCGGSSRCSRASSLVFVVLFAVRRSTREAAIPLIPIALATGWSALVLFLLRIPLNPMSAVMGALVIAISTEFSVLLSARYREERAGGAEPEEAIDATYALDRRGRARLGRHGDHGLRGADRLRHPHAARLRRRDGGRPDRLAARRDGRAAGGARLGRAAQLRRCSDLDPRGWWRALREELSGVRRRARAWRCRARGSHAAPLACLTTARLTTASAISGRASPPPPSASPSSTRATWRPSARSASGEAPGPPRPGGRYTWVVGVAALIVIIVVAFNSLPNAGRGYRGPEKGERHPGLRRAARDERRGGRRERQAGRGRRRAGERHARLRRRRCPGSSPPASCSRRSRSCWRWRCRRTTARTQLEAMEALSRERPRPPVRRGDQRAPARDRAGGRGAHRRDLPGGGRPRPRRLQPLPRGVLQHGDRRPRRAPARVPREQRRSSARGAREDAAVTIETGWVDADLQAEFPELRLRWIEHEGGSGRTPLEIKERLRGLSDRYTGGKAVHLRQEPIPWAYRVFFRQVGIDPDDHRTPAEQAALDRMKHGSFRSRNLLDDALVIATVETGVPRDGARRGPRRRRRSGCGSRTRASGSAARTGGRCPCARSSSPIPTARVAVLFGDIAEDRGVRSGHEPDAAVQRAGEGRARDQRGGGPLDRHRGTADGGAEALSSSRGQRAEATSAVPAARHHRARRAIRPARPPRADRAARVGPVGALLLGLPARGLRLGGPVPRRAADALAVRARAAPRRPGRAAARRPPHAQRPHLGRGAEPRA